MLLIDLNTIQGKDLKEPKNNKLFKIGNLVKAVGESRHKTKEELLEVTEITKS